MTVEKLHSVIHRIESLKEKAKQHAHDHEIVQLLHIRIHHYEAALKKAEEAIDHIHKHGVLDSKMHDSHVAASVDEAGEHHETKGQSWR